jgi:hypothetical protein
MLRETLTRFGRAVGIAGGVGHNCPKCREVRFARIVGAKLPRHSLQTRFSRNAGHNEAMTDIHAAEDCVDPRSTPLVRLGQGDYTVEVKP